MTINNANTIHKEGWKILHIYGSPYNRGKMYGKAASADIEKMIHALDIECKHLYKKSWSFFVEAGKKILKPAVQAHYPELYEEMEGISHGSGQSVDSIIAINGQLTLMDSWWPQVSDATQTMSNKKENTRCRAFIATGGFTADGKIVVAHNTHSYYIDGQYGNYILYVTPEKGNQMVMQTYPGCISSITDFFITSAGIVGTETTISDFLPYEEKDPCFCRIRKAMQYGNSLDDYVEIMLTRNSGDYACSWLFGDIRTNEIRRFEIGLDHHSVNRTNNGYYIGFNIPYDESILNEETAISQEAIYDTGVSTAASKVRLTELLEMYKGILNVQRAKKIIGDHYDIYLEKTIPSKRTICKHDEETMSGALDGKVADAESIKKMEFYARWGCSKKNKVSGWQVNHMEPSVIRRWIRIPSIVSHTERHSHSRKKSRATTARFRFTRKTKRGVLI